MKAVLLAGGLGTRIREESEFRPKPMVEIGGRPILWHIMKHLSSYGIKDFIIATGYKSNMIKEYFLNYEPLGNDFTISLGDRNSLQIHGEHDESDWKVTVALTGDKTETGGRVFKAAQYLDPNEDFFLTYGDGLANVDIDALRKRHAESGKLATITTVQPTSRFCVINLDDN
jgi:glucose-1-phosphate cytidylyltransferase